MGQNAEVLTKEKHNSVLKSELTARKKVERISKDPKVQNKTINFKKSHDLISVKAYMRSLQLKRKETLMS